VNYTQTLDYLFTRLPMFHRIGAAAYKADLDNTIAICKMLGDPHHQFRSVHVAGTNGKGSVSHMLASILEEAGYKTGLYTSPHLKDFRERIRVNGKMIPRSAVTRFVKTQREEFERIQPSFFEWTVGLAFDHFRNEKVDIAVIEVGLGGRLDSTNIITPLVSVITNISFDHMQFLGDRLDQIAAEKAGIIKAGIPVIIGEYQPDIAHIFEEKACKEGSGLNFADHLFSVMGVKKRNSPSAGLILQIKNNQDDKEYSVTSPLPGQYQKKNILTVIAAANTLREQGFSLPEELIISGIKNVIKNTGIKGRWQVLSRNPLTICDTGHNTAGIKEVLEQIRQTPHKELHFVMGLVNDKEIGNILSLLPANATYYFCKADIPRGLDAELLREAAAANGLKGESYITVKTALEAARKNAGSDDLVFVGGSTFVVAEVV
jgi:dihydrofolate synthase / folylpolyglutamate synthase